MKKINRVKVMQAFRAYETCTVYHLHMFVVNDYYDQGEDEMIRLFALAPMLSVSSELGLHLAEDLVYRDEWGKELKVVSDLVNELEAKMKKNLWELQDSYI